MNALTSWDDFDELEDEDARVPRRRVNPTELVWPPTLPIEIALRVAPLRQIKEAYGFTDEQWEDLRVNPVFIRDLAAAVEAVKQDGMSFKLKARLQAESLLDRSWAMIHDPTVASSVKADLLKSTMRWAGYDNKEAATQQNAVGLNIQINL